MLSHDNLVNHPDAFHDFTVENLYYPDANQILSIKKWLKSVIKRV
jgi:hypothetical protein